MGTQSTEDAQNAHRQGRRAVDEVVPATGGVESAALPLIMGVLGKLQARNDEAGIALSMSHAQVGARHLHTHTGYQGAAALFGPLFPVRR